MRVNGVPPVEVARPAIVAAFAFLHNTDALIIDDRGNAWRSTYGCHLRQLLEWGKPFVVNNFRWREGGRVEEFTTTDLGDLAYGVQKPVFVLTSPMTFSGGEELAYDLQALKRAVVVGEVTGGGANPVTLIELGHHFIVSIAVRTGDQSQYRNELGADWCLARYPCLLRQPRWTSARTCPGSTGGESFRSGVEGGV